MWNYRTIGVFFGVFILFIIVVPNYSGQPSDPTFSEVFDENQFRTSSRSLTSSPDMIKKLAENEELVYIILKDFYLQHGLQKFLLLPPDEEPFRLIHSYLLNFELTTGQQSLKLEKQDEHTKRAHKTSWNPLTTYFLFQRLVKQLKDIVRSLDTTYEAGMVVKKQILNIMDSTGWPQERDLVDVTSGILRIQHVYNLDTYQLSIGNFAGYETNVMLTPVDCLEIGKRAIVELYYGLAVEWFQIAQMKLKYSPGSPAKAITNVDHYVKHAQELHDHQWNLRKRWDPLLFTTPVTHSNELPLIRRRTAELQDWEDYRSNYTNKNYNEVIYWGTCSGKNYKSKLEKSRLFCWYETERSHWLKINPQRAELLSAKPFVVIQYYDLIGAKMIEKIKQEVTKTLTGSVVADNNYKPASSSFRTSSNSWIDDSMRPEYFSISRTIEAVTGLKVRSPYSSEKLQVAAYTSGSHYNLHRDALEANFEMSYFDLLGDRIATFMIYLNDVEKGGGTSFPQAGFSADPIKGSALLRFNILQNGEADKHSIHGGCPVIIGEKWISNKWIRSHDQMFLKDYQCTLDQDAGFRLPINGKDILE